MTPSLLPCMQVQRGSSDLLRFRMAKLEICACDAKSRAAPDVNCVTQWATSRIHDDETQ